MFRLLSLVFGVAIVLLFVPLAGAQPYYSPVVDFEGDTGSPELHQEMFRIPEWSTSTTDFVVANTPGTFDSNFAYRSTQWPITGDSSLWVSFDWVDPADPDAWMRLSTYNADVWPNPAVHLGGKVRFSLVNEGDWANGQVGICLGIRETGEPVPLLEDGGVIGDVEWVGVSGTAGSGDDVRPIPTFTLPVHGAYVLIEFDLSTGNIWVGTQASGYVLQNMGGGYGAMTGDGVLDGTRGTLEHIAITNVSTDTLATMSLYIDDLRVESPDPDPVYPPTVVGPITMGDDTITVTDLLGTADQVTLYRGTPPVFVETKTLTPPIAPGTLVDFIIAPLAATGECFVATQRESISSDTSDESDPVCALPGPAAYTFNVCLDENGSNCSTDWEMVPAESKGTAPNGQVAPHGQIIFPNNAVWQTIDIPLDVPALVTFWLGGDGVIAPGGTGLFSFDSFWFTSLGGADAMGNHEVFIDAIEALDHNDDVIASIYSMENGVNYMSNSRSQGSSSFTTTELSTLASYDGQTSHHFEWTYSTATVDETVASYNAIGWACGTSPTFPDTTKTVRVRLLARAEYTGSAPQPAVSAPIIGNQAGVRVTNDATATAVQLYIDGIAEGDPVLPTGTETDFTGLSLEPGNSVSVRQTVAGETSDYAYPVVVSEKPFPPTLPGPLVIGDTEVTVASLASAPYATASLVEVFVNGSPAGSEVPAGDSVVVTVPQLNNNDVVEARQTVNSTISEFSDSILVQWPAPVIYYVPADGDTVVKVTGIEATATQVTVTVDSTPFSVTYDPNIAPFEVTVTPALTAGQVVVANYTVGAVDSVDSISETVCVATPTDVFRDDFESYTSQAEFDAVWTAAGTQMLFSEDHNTTAGGSNSAHAPDRNFRSTAGVLTGVAGTDLEPAVFSINILDPSGEPGTTQYADLNNMTTDWFLAEIGIYVAAGAQTHYQARLTGNGGPGWFHLDQFDGPERVAGWHNFTMVFKGPPAGEAEGHEVDIYVDGLLATKNLPLNANTVLREPRMGAGLSAVGAPEGYFDDYALYTGPPSFPILPPPPPRIVSPIEEGDETVRVEDILDGVTLVEVFANGASIGSIDPAGENTIYVPVTALVQFNMITATQLTTTTSVQSSGLEVGNGNGDLFLSIGVRETGDAGALGTPGTTGGEIEWIGTTAVVGGAPQGMPVSPSGDWQTIEFSPLQVQGFTGDGAITETRGVLEHLAVAVNAASPSRSTGAYQIYIDNVINLGAGTGGTDFVITDFEGFTLGSETLFQEPGNSGSTAPHSVYPPDYSATVDMGNPGQSQELGWFWIDTQAQRWQRISTLAVPNVESPIIDLTKPIQLDILILERGMLKGDLNCDGLVNGKDIQAFVLRLTNPTAYSAQYPGCPDFNGDIDGNGSVGMEDIDPFATLLAD